MQSPRFKYNRSQLKAIMTGSLVQGKVATISPMLKPLKQDSCVLKPGKAFTLVIVVTQITRHGQVRLARLVIYD